MAITLHRPWAYAIAHLGKDVENRSWKCPLEIGSYLAIHAGKKFDKDAAEWIKSVIGKPCPDEDKHPTGIVAIAAFKGNLETSNSPWFVGPIGWQIDQILAIPSIKCNGKQGLWSLDKSTLEQVRENYVAAYNRLFT